MDNYHTEKKEDGNHQEGEKAMEKKKKNIPEQRLNAPQRGPSLLWHFQRDFEGPIQPTRGKGLREIRVKRGRNKELCLLEKIEKGLYLEHNYQQERREHGHPASLGRSL